MKLENIFLKTTFAALFVLGVGIFTSVSFSALGHILLVFPSGYFFYKGLKEKREWSKSMLALMVLILISIISVITNLDIIANPFKNIFKIKYFAIGFLSIFAFENLFHKEITKKQIKVLIYAFLIVTTLASLSGLIALYTGFNPLKMKVACHESRTCGVYGMYMTYGYGISLFMILITGILIYHRKISSWISFKALIPIWAINFVGFALSFARGAWAGYFVALPFFFFKKRKRLFLKITIAILILGGVSVTFSPKLRETFFSPSRIRSGTVRISQYEAAWKAFKERPLFGYGYKNFEPHSKEIKERYQIEFEYFSGHAHSNFIEHLASTGVLGFLSLLLFHIFWIREMYLRDDVIGKICFPFAISFLISGLFQYTFGDGENLFLIMTVYSLSQIKLGRSKLRPN